MTMKKAMLAAAWLAVSAGAALAQGNAYTNEADLTFALVISVQNPTVTNGPAEKASYTPYKVTNRTIMDLFTTERALPAFSDQAKLVWVGGEDGVVVRDPVNHLGVDVPIDMHLAGLDVTDEDGGMVYAGTRKETVSGPVTKISDSGKFQAAATMEWGGAFELLSGMNKGTYKFFQPVDGVGYADGAGVYLKSGKITVAGSCQTTPLPDITGMQWPDGVWPIEGTITYKGRAVANP